MKKSAQKTMAPGVGTKTQKAAPSYEWEEEEDEAEPTAGAITAAATGPKDLDDLADIRAQRNRKLSDLGKLTAPTPSSVPKASKGAPDIGKKKRKKGKKNKH